MATRESTSSNGGSSKDYAALQKDLERLRSDFQALGEHLGELGSNRAARVRASGEAKLEDLAAEIDRLTGGLEARGRNLLTQVTDTVQERPVMSLLAAFGVGILLSAILGRRSS